MKSASITQVTRTDGSVSNTVSVMSFFLTKLLVVTNSDNQKIWPKNGLNCNIFSFKNIQPEMLNWVVQWINRKASDFFWIFVVILSLLRTQSDMSFHRPKYKWCGPLLTTEQGFKRDEHLLDFLSMTPFFPIFCTNQQKKWRETHAKAIPSTSLLLRDSLVGKLLSVTHYEPQTNWIEFNK